MKNEPEVLEIETQDSRAQIRICFPSTYRYFDGHFDAMPILPGVAQLDTAIRLAMQVFARKAPTGMKAVKFKSVIKPDTTVELELQQQGNVVTFAYRDRDHMYGGGKILF